MALALFALLSACQPRTTEEAAAPVDTTPVLVNEPVSDSEEDVEEDAYPSFVYTNEEYGFSLELPENWAGYTAVERPENAGGYTRVIDFSLKGVSIFAISMHTAQEWAEISSQEGPIGTEVGSNDDWVFVYSGAQDTGDDVDLITARGEVDTIMKTFKAL